MIRIVSTTFVRPERVKYSEKQRDEFNGNKIDLGPSDLQFLLMDPIQTGLLFHKPPAKTTLSLVNYLRDSFAQTLSVYYPLAGRLISVDNNDDDDTQSFFIDCNDGGAEFVHATADGRVTATDILDPVIIPDALLYSLFSMNDVVSHDAANSDLPLLSAQVTELADAVFVACTLIHSVGDGAFFWRFFRAWSEITREGIEVLDLDKHQVFGRGFLDGIVDLPIRVPKRSLVEDTVFKRPDPEKLPHRMFRFSKATVAELKARANAEVRANGTPAMGEISSLQALLAHLWIAVTRSRGLASGEVVTYEVLIGLRQRLGLAENLSDEYLGNATRVVAGKSTAGEVIRGGLGAAALLIKKTVASQTPREVRGHLKAWPGTAGGVRSRSKKFNKLQTGSSPRYDVYGCDFGWGRPAAFRSCPGSKFDGMLYAFPGSEHGSIDFEACFYANTLAALQSDPDFTRTLS